MSAAAYPPGLDPARFTIDVDPMFRACLPADVAAAVLFLASDEAAPSTAWSCGWIAASS